MTPEVQHIRDEARQAYLGEDFTRLDRMIEEYQRTDARTAGGNEKVQQIYYVLSNSRLLYGTTDDESLAKAERLADRWVKARPDSRAARLTVANAMFDRAWYIRGNGAISTVSPDRFVAFVKLLKEAESYLQANKATLSLDPDWYVLMMGIQMNFTDEDGFKALADEALGRFPHYLPIQWAIMDKVLPQWGGSAKWQFHWLDRIAEVDSPGAYARAFWYLLDEMFPDGILPDWAKLKPGFEQIISRYPTNRNLNGYAYFACVAGDMQELTELLKRIGPDLDADVWHNQDFVRSCRQRASAPIIKQPPLAEWYLVEAYGRREPDGPVVILLGPIDLPSEKDAIARARELASRYDGVQAYKLTPQPDTREYGKPIVLFSSGTVPTRFEQ